ncbi:hypothetical protein PP7435_CHR1-0370 [Komagataella phaffii CBS 7435]|uniref:Probable endonuclease LCL3 n=2 Tax=Komagataella phaffii TaxID=460519 RepID=LCL3_KOMPG|nr:uncharacterized protein PAS_chr1-1_0068 [Komagataella phaffii GS115]C4QW04.1 RecName: Full=Probable endonuclease LCL3 [Komagataella phaffii GS115]AOA61196.1 GQ67_02634T0 [Komagataella phaffii]KAI0465165.1 putative endonuclease lcl3 [Komagataella kurtzmanii]CAH2446091.1 hypothetical protein BQ9382_C1-1910 [Komagataella phaffii CBS 7435]AOA66188.1 GQ68_02614T0 [Komagataella phaffii GS115]CAY67427.1 Putative protein of unknown function, has homology to Staphylococcus aureus nuclease [Komagata
MAQSNQHVSIYNPKVIVYSIGLTTAILASMSIYRSHFVRFSTSLDVPKTLFRTKHLHGKVTSVGDGDNFHFYHLPGGIFAGWGWIRETPEINKFRKLKNKTIHVRLCGVDAPERSHFGKPSQPYSEEALQWLRQFILGKKVKVKPLSVDQYNRIVGRVFIFRWNGWNDVSEEMLRNGVAIVYENKSSAEFDGMKERYLKVENKAKKKKKGLWGIERGLTPGEYKRLYK